MRPLRLLSGLVFLVFAGTALAGLPTLTYEGREYVELSRVAAILKTRLEATAQSTQAQLRPAGHVITVTRNWSRILVDGVPVVLDAPARVRRGVWLVPDTFLARVQPRVQPVTTVQPVAAGAPATTAPTVKAEAATAAPDRSAGRARDEAARAAVRAERVLAHEAGGLHRLRGGTIRCGGIDADRARRARVAEIVAAALDEKRSEPLFCGGLSHDARRGVSTGPASSGLDGRTGADNALVLTEIALIALKLVLQASHADPQQPGRLGAVPPGLFECFEDVQLLDFA